MIVVCYDNQKSKPDIVHIVAGGLLLQVHMDYGM